MSFKVCQENPDAELQGKLLAEDPNPIDTAKRTLKKELKQLQAIGGRVGIICAELGQNWGNRNQGNEVLRMFPTFSNRV